MSTSRPCPRPLAPLLLGCLLATVLAAADARAAQTYFDSKLDLEVYALTPSGAQGLLGRTPAKDPAGIAIPDGVLWFVRPTQPRPSPFELRLLAEEILRRGIPGLSLYNCIVRDDDLGQLSRMARLEYLDLGRSPGISEEALKYLHGLRALRTLSLAETHAATGKGLAELARLPNLAELDLSRTEIGDLDLAPLADFPALIALRLNECRRISSAGLATIGRIKRLTRLELYNCDRVGDAGIESIAALKQLQMLQLGRTRISEDGVRLLAGLRELREFDLSYAGVNDKTLPLIASLPKIERLNLSVTPITDDAMPAFQKCPGLASLSLGGCRWVTDSGLVHLRHLANLERLDLSQMRIGASGLAHVAALKKLMHLDLSYTQVDAAALAQLAGLNGLQELHLAATPVDRAALEKVAALTGLKVLNLRKCANLGADGLSALAPLTGLRILDLQHARCAPADLAALRRALPNLYVIE